MIRFTPTRKDAGTMSDILRQIAEKLYAGDDEAVAELTQKALDEGVSAMVIVEGTLRAAMNEVGERFSRAEFYLPDLILASEAMKNATKTLRPLLVGEEGLADQETVVIGTVEGDLHDIGKNLVIATLEGAGHRVVDLGIDAPPGKFIEAVREHDPAVVSSRRC